MNAGAPAASAVAAVKMAKTTREPRWVVLNELSGGVGAEWGLF
jgi:hypothetical protein